MEKKTQSEMEQIALLELRKSKDKKLLSNTSFDCFVMGYGRAQEELRAAIESVMRGKKFNCLKQFE